MTGLWCRASRPVTLEDVQTSNTLDVVFRLALAARDRLPVGTTDPGGCWCEISRVTVGREVVSLFEVYEAGRVLPSGLSLAVCTRSFDAAEFADALNAGCLGRALWISGERPPGLMLALDFARRLKPKDAKLRLASWNSLSPGDLEFLRQNPTEARFRDKVAKPATEWLASGELLNRRALRKFRGSPELRRLLCVHVPLEKDDAQLRALLALRCAQQGYRADAARDEVRRYAQKVGVHGSLLDHVTDEAIRCFLVAVPDGLPRYLKESARYQGLATWTKDASLKFAEAGGRVPVPAGERPWTVLDLALELRVSREAIYYWIKQGIARPLEQRRYRFSQEEVERLKKWRNKPKSILYKIIMKRMGVTYDAARMRVCRRVKAGATFKQILEEIGVTDELYHFDSLSEGVYGG